MLQVEVVVIDSEDENEAILPATKRKAEKAAVLEEDDEDTNCENDCDVDACIKVFFLGIGQRLCVNFCICSEVGPRRVSAGRISFQ